MSKRADPPVLPREAEELLRSWPVPEKEDSRWEQNAESVMARVAMVRAGSTDRALLEPPLPASSSPNGSSPISLADLARSVAAESAADDAKQLAQETLSAATRARVSAPQSSDPEPELAPTAAPEPAPASPPIATPLRAKRSFVAPMLATGLAVIGMAAAAVIVIRSQQQAAAPVAATPIIAPDRRDEPSPAAVEPTPDPQTVSPEELGQPEEKPLAAPKALAPVAAGAAPVQPSKTVEKAEPTPTETATPPSAPAKDESEAAKMKPAAQPMDVPQQPSNGAAQAAVAQVIGSARACVAGHDAPSRATIVFGSNGRVQSVSISGPAAGTPAEACIRAALSGARVEPFAKPTFSVGATVRP
jgi:hypothetical protein